MSIGPNSFDHNPGYRDKAICTGIRLVDTANTQISGCVIQDASAGKTTVIGAKAFPRLGLIELVRSRQIGMSGCQILDGASCGVYVEDSSNVLLSGLTITEDEAETARESLVCWRGTGEGNLITGCHIGRGGMRSLAIDREAGVALQANLVHEEHR